MVKARVPAPYGWRVRGFTGPNNPPNHNGVDYGFYNADPAKSKQTFAAAPGRVRTVAWSELNGWYIVIQHTDRTDTRYVHYDPGTVKVKVGQWVDYSTFLGPMGNSGKSTGPHLHWGMTVDGKFVNPEKYLTEDMPGKDINMNPNQRRATKAMARRTEPSAKGGNETIIPPGVQEGDVITPKGWVLGDHVREEGNAWYVIDGPNGTDLYTWSGGYEPRTLVGVPDLNPKPEPELDPRIDELLELARKTLAVAIENQARITSGNDRFDSVFK